jgi:hypothetical protein
MSKYVFFGCRWHTVELWIDCLSYLKPQRGDYFMSKRNISNYKTKNIAQKVAKNPLTQALEDQGIVCGQTGKLNWWQTTVKVVGIGLVTGLILYVAKNFESLLDATFAALGSLVVALLSGVEPESFTEATNVLQGWIVLQWNALQSAVIGAIESVSTATGLSVQALLFVALAVVVGILVARSELLVQALGHIVQGFLRGSYVVLGSIRAFINRVLPELE